MPMANCWVSHESKLTLFWNGITIEQSLRVSFFFDIEALASFYEWLPTKCQRRDRKRRAG